MKWLVWFASILSFCSVSCDKNPTAPSNGNDRVVPIFSTWDRWQVKTAQLIVLPPEAKLCQNLTDANGTPIVNQQQFKIIGTIDGVTGNAGANYTFSSDP